MPQHAQDQARIVRVRLPADLLQRLERVLDWQAPARQRPAPRHAASREALRAGLDDHEQRAGLVEPHRLWQQFQTASQSLASHPDGVPIHQRRQRLPWPRERFDTVLEALRAAQHVDLETGTARALGPQALADSYQVHGQLDGRVRWRACAGVALLGVAWRSQPPRSIALAAGRPPRYHRPPRHP